MRNIDDFKRHGGGTVNRVFVTARRAKPTLASKGNKSHMTAFVAAEQGTAVR